MPDIASILQTGTSNPWLYLPVAALLGALHALEPGHSKSMMAAFIIAIHGTAAEAVILGVSAAIGHTIVVWVLAAIGLYLGDRLIIDKAEPWLLLATGVIVVALAFRLFRLLRGEGAEAHDHTHASHDHNGHDHRHGHAHSPALSHAQTHEREIAEKFGGAAHVTRTDIVWFGFTSGLLPCPAAIAVLLVCLQLKAFTLGMGLVAAFSFGLAVTLVAVGAAAAWGARSARMRWSGMGEWARYLPYGSAAIVGLIGAVMVVRGLLTVTGTT